MYKVYWIIFFLTISHICLAQGVLPDAKIITYSTTNNTLEKALYELFEESGVNISFNPDNLPKEANVSIDATEKPLGDILNEALAGSFLTYKVVGNQIVVYQSGFSKLKNSYTISGYVEELESSERLVYANIYTEDKKYLAASNEYGFYSLTIPKGEYVLQYSYVGREQASKFVRLTKDTVMHVGLASTTLLNEIVISKSRPVVREDIEDAVKLPLNKMFELPNLGGEADIMRFAQMQSGVTSGADGFGGLHVRGGNVDHNLILLDGVPVYNPSHALGIFSIFNSSVIKSAKLIKNGMPARYGGRLGSVLDVRTREGNMKKFAGDVSMGTAAVKASIEGPLIKDKVSILLSGRRTFLDPWIKLFSNFLNNINNNEGVKNFFFYDFNAKLNAKLGNSNRIYFSLYNGRDSFIDTTKAVSQLENRLLTETDRGSWDWGNTIGTFRWNILFGQKFFANVSANYSRFNFELFKYDELEKLLEDQNEPNISYTGSLFKSEIEDYGGQLDMTYLASPSYTLRFGGGAVRHNFTPGLITANQTDALVPIESTLTKEVLRDTLKEPLLLGNEFTAYVENEFEPVKGLAFNVGVFGSWINTSGNDYYSLQPRTSLKIGLGTNSFLKASYAETNQFLHLLSNNAIGLPSDIWLPSTSNIAPSSSWQSSVSIELGLGKGMGIEIAGFYKEMSDILTYQEGQLFTINETEDWEEGIPVGRGRAFGGEFQLSRSVGRLTGWANYTYSHSLRQFDEVNDGEEFNARFDRRHNFKLAWVLRLSKSIELSSNWIYASGSAYTEPVTFIIPPELDIFIPIIESRNNANFKDYHRLDVSFNFYNKFSWGQSKLSIGAYNAYNRLNPFYSIITRDPIRLVAPELQTVSIFPIIPSLSYNLSF